MGSNWLTTVGAIFLVFLCAIALACERDTKIRVEGGNPPRFVMRGNGVLTAVRVRGPNRQRNVEGEAASLYWLIETKGDSATNDNVSSIGPITYGVVPSGFQQISREWDGTSTHRTRTLLCSRGGFRSKRRRRLLCNQ